MTTEFAIDYFLKLYVPPATRESARAVLAKLVEAERAKAAAEVMRQVVAGAAT